MTVMFFATDSISQAPFLLGGLSDQVLPSATQREFTVLSEKVKKGESSQGTNFLLLLNVVMIPEIM